MRIALDAMGGDRGPEMAILGALAAVQEQNELSVILVGPHTVLEPQLTEKASGRSELLQRITIHHASDVITMDESPVDAVRKKKRGNRGGRF